MPDAQLPAFEFTIQGLPQDAFQVVSYSGQEGLSILYQFDVLLASTRSDIDLDAVQRGRATLTMKRPGKQNLTWGGIVLDFDQMEQNHGLSFYRATLVPRAWWLTQIHNTQIFLNLEWHGILQAVIEQAGLSEGVDFEFRLATTYAHRDWTCQYNETNWNFFNRYMERGGLYFFFEQGSEGEKLVVTDTAMAHVPLPGEEALTYAPPSGLDDPQGLEIARSFRCALKQLPKEVRIRDYNYRTTNLPDAVQPINPHGVATIYRHIEDLRNNSEARYVAKARAQGIACRGKLFHGETAAPYLRPGYNFKLNGHFRNDFNQSYTTIELRHEGHQEAYITTNEGRRLTGKGKPFYRNTFTAIPANVQFRPEPKTMRPVALGPVPGWIDAEGSGKYAEIDSMGRYKVRFPFDLSGRKDGKASQWIRLSTPYGGEGHGLHMPLLKGTEVLVGFINGNPDRPVIIGVIPNAQQKMASTSDTNTMHILTTAGNNKIHMQDHEGLQAIMLSSPAAGSYFRLGSPEAGSSGVGESKSNPPGSAFSEDGLNLYTTSWLNIKCQENLSVTLGNKNELVVGLLTDHVLGGRTEVTLGVGLMEFISPLQKVISPESVKMEESLTRINTTATQMRTDITNVTTDLNNLTTNRIDIMDQNIITVGQRVATVETGITTHGERLQNVENSTLLCASRIESVESHVSNCATKTQLTDTANLVFTELDEVCSNVSRISDVTTKLSQEITEMADAKEELIEDITFLIGACTMV